MGWNLVMKDLSLYVLTLYVCQSLCDADIFA